MNIITCSKYISEMQWKLQVNSFFFTGYALPLNLDIRIGETLL